MTTKFKDKGTDVDQLYLNRSNYIIGGSLVASGSPSSPWRVNSYFYSNWREPYLGEELGWFKFSYLKNVSPCHTHYSSPLYAFKEDGIYFWGEDTYLKVPGLAGQIHTSSSPFKAFSEPWQDVQITNLNTFALKSNGTLWANGDMAVLGLSPTLRMSTNSWSLYPPNIFWKQVVAGPNDLGTGAAYGIDVSGNLWVTGTNSSGKLGLGVALDVVVSAWTQLGTNTWKYLSDSVGHGILAIDTSGRLWAWGSNSNFRLGTGGATTASYSTPVQIGTATNWLMCTLSSSQGAGIRSPGLLYTWGDNLVGCLGDGTTVNKSTPIQVGTLSSWIWVSASGGTISGIRWSPSVAVSGMLLSTGFNGQGQLGDGTVADKSIMTRVGTGTNWLSIKRDPAGSAAYAKTAAGTVYVWGIGANGQLGLGHSNNCSTPVLINSSVHLYYNIHNSTGWFGSTIDLRTTGINTEAFGAVPVSTPVVIATITSPVTYATRGFFVQTVTTGSGALYIGGTTANHYGHNYEQSLYCTSSFVQLGTSSWKMMDVWSNFAHFIRSDDTLWTLGTVSGPVLGNGTTSATISSLVQIGSSNTWSTIGGSGWHKLAIDTSGRLWAWGNNAQYQLGRGNNTAVSTPVQVGSLSGWTAIFNSPHGASYAQCSNVTYVWGSTTYGLLWTGANTVAYSTPVALATTWSKIHSTGDHHAVGLKPDGTIWGVGYSLDDNRTLEMDRSGYIAYAIYSSAVQLSGKNTWVNIEGWDDQAIGILAGGEN